MTVRPTEKLRDLLARATPGPWCLNGRTEIWSSPRSAAFAEWEAQHSGDISAEELERAPWYEVADTLANQEVSHHEEFVPEARPTAELIVALRNNAEALLDAADLLARARHPVECYLIGGFDPSRRTLLNEIDAVLARLRG